MLADVPLAAKIFPIFLLHPFEEGSEVEFDVGILQSSEVAFKMTTFLLFSLFIIVYFIMSNIRFHQDQILCLLLLLWHK